MKLKKIAASIAAGLLIMLPCADIGTSGSISASNTVSAYAVYENELDNYDDYDEYENDEYSGTESDSEADSDSERNPLKSFIISLIIGIVIAAVSVGIMWSQMKTVRSQSELQITRKRIHSSCVKAQIHFFTSDLIRLLNRRIRLKKIDRNFYVNNLKIRLRYLIG